MKKFRVVGWVRKGDGTPGLNFSDDPDGVVCLPDIYERRGTKHDWDSCDWPPMKVIVTLEYKVKL